MKVRSPLTPPPSLLNVRIAVASLTEETFATSSFVMELRRLDEAVAGVKAVHPLDIEHQTIFKVLAPRAASQVQRLQRLQGELVCPVVLRTSCHP